MSGKIRVDDLVPLTHELGRSNPAYLQRVQPLLPDFPSEVLSSWFGEQPDTVKTYAFLGYDRLLFERVEFEIHKLPGEETFRDGAKSINALINESAWMKRGLKHCMETNKNWPVPPILLDTNASVLPQKVPLILKQPYHLLEGYHRVALAHSYVSTRVITTSLAFWVARIT